MAEPPKKKIELPIEEELKSLSRSALLTYSIRCALRVLPFLKESIETSLIFQNGLYLCALYSTGSFSQNSTEQQKYFRSIKALVNRTTDSNIKFAVHASQAIRATVNLASDLELTEMQILIKQAYFVSEAMVECISESGLKMADNAILEIRQDFNDLSERYPQNSGFVDKDYYSKPLWLHLNESEFSVIEKVVGEWIEIIQSQSEPSSTIRYTHFFLDSRRYGEIPWFEIETDVWDWLAKLEEEPENSGELNEVPKMYEMHNLRGAAVSLGGSMSNEDLLGREMLVNAMADIIASPGQDTPFTIGLLGDWGSGKSNVMHLLRNKLGARADYERFYFADFNAWEYEHTDNMAAGVAQEVLKGFLERKTTWEKFVIKWKFGKLENGVLLPLILLSVFVVAVTSLIMIFQGESQGWVAAFGVAGVIIAGFIKQIFTILEHPLTAKVNNYLKLPSYAVHLGTIPILKKHLKILSALIIPPFEKYPNRLIVFVDDLDRCEPRAISKTLDAIRLVMDIENVVVIIGIDHRIAFRAVEKQYVDLADDIRTSADIARDYLGKIIQLPIMLNNPGMDELESFISNKLFRNVKDELAKLDVEERITTSIENNDAVDLVDKNASSLYAPSENGSESLSNSGMDETDSSLKNRLLRRSNDRKTLLSQAGSDESAEMTDTAEEKSYFTEMCSLFGLHNPRQLIRLRNCYRLLKRIESPNEEEWRPQMLLLFWLEFLYMQPYHDRMDIEKCFRDRDPHSLNKQITNKGFDQNIFETIELKLNLQPGDFSFYERIVKEVNRLVLPHSESAKRAKEEEQAGADEKIEPSPEIQTANLKSA